MYTQQNTGCNKTDHYQMSYPDQERHRNQHMTEYNNRVNHQNYINSQNLSTNNSSSLVDDYNFSSNTDYTPGNQTSSYVGARGCSSSTIQPWVEPTPEQWKQIHESWKMQLKQQRQLKEWGEHPLDFILAILGFKDLKLVN